MGQTFLFTALYVVLDLVLALGLALALNQKVRGLAFFRAAYFLPVVSSMVVGAILWSWVFDPRFGLANAALAGLHLGPVRWLQDARTGPARAGGGQRLEEPGLRHVAVPGRFASRAGRATGGGSPGRRRSLATLPPRHPAWLGPTLVLVGMMATIRAFQTFDTVYLMTEGGPHRSTTLVGYWLFQNAFTYFKLGKASALAYVLFAVLAGVSALQWAARRRLAHQEAMKRWAYLALCWAPSSWRSRSC